MRLLHCLVQISIIIVIVCAQDIPHPVTPSISSQSYHSLSSSVRLKLRSPSLNKGGTKALSHRDGIEFE